MLASFTELNLALDGLKTAVQGMPPSEKFASPDTMVYSLSFMNSSTDNVLNYRIYHFQITHDLDVDTGQRYLITFRFTVNGVVYDGAEVIDVGPIVRMAEPIPDPNWYGVPTDVLVTGILQTTVLDV